MFNQQLFKRTFKEHTLRYCASLKLYGSSLNSLERARDGVPGLKTLNNNPDAYLTLIKGGKALC
ncbi:MAG: hypothetical protein M1412_08245 [Deltaproteobacteria bacterium]|nr:hypothetical protein [Deltaproteobacteria bacterium]MCL5893132.1 hypothetical protein [Deltaproteobacteria bacterium]